MKLAELFGNNLDLDESQAKEFRIYLGKVLSENCFSDDIKKQWDDHKFLSLVTTLVLAAKHNLTKSQFEDFLRGIG